MSWLDDLEARLESQLEGFLRDNPSQEALLAEQERRDRLESLRRRRRELQEEAEQSRQALLQLASEIRSWQARVERARAAGAQDLASRAEAHGADLMEQGRRRWQHLGELGQQFSAVEWELSQLERPPAASSQAASTGDEGSAHRRPAADQASPGGEAPPTQGNGDSLQDAWAAFEAEQDLQALKARLRR